MSAAFANRASDFDRREEILPHFVNIYFFKACNLPFPSADSSWLVLLLSARSTNRAALPHVPALAYLCAYVCCQPTPSLLPLPAAPSGSETSTIPPLAAYRALSLSLSLSLSHTRPTSCFCLQHLMAEDTHYQFLHMHCHHSTLPAWTESPALALLSAAWLDLVARQDQCFIILPLSVSKHVP